jgi:hypothetical protein
MIPESAELTAAIVSATRAAARRLFLTGESFYYFTLITTGEAHAPIISAWSREKLAALPEEDREMCEWSYADSPYCGFGEEYFSEVNALFLRCPHIHTMEDEDYAREYELRLNVMEAALAELDAEGLFGIGPERDQVVVLVEVMPPDYTNTERARRLNPPSALETWLREAAE